MQRHSPSERVVRVVADEADTDPLDLPPLHYAIDTDVLDAAVMELDEGCLQFRYEDWLVSAYGDGSIEVSDVTSTVSERETAAADD